MLHHFWFPLPVKHQRMSVLSPSHHEASLQRDLQHSHLTFPFPVTIHWLVSNAKWLFLLQTGHQAASTAVDSDSDDDGEFDQYSELDAFDADEVEVSPDDEQALAAFMVIIAISSFPLVPSAI